MKLRACLLCLLLSLGALHTAWAQGTGDDVNMERLIEGSEVTKETTAMPIEKAMVPKTNLEPINLQVQWQLWKTLVTQGKPSSDAIRTLHEDAISLGHENMPAAAMGSISMILRLHAEGTITTENAIEALGPIETLAPDLPYPSLATARFIVRHDPGRIGEVVQAFTRGLSKAIAWPDTALPWRFNLIIYALLATLGAGLVFIGAQMIRHFHILSYDLMRRLPAGFSSNQSVVVLVALLIVPGLLLQSPLLSALLLLLSLCFVQQMRERVVTLALFLVIAALPILDRGLSEALTWSTSPTQTLLRAQYETCERACIEELDALHQANQELQNPPDPILEYSLMLALYRDGQTQRVLSEFEAPRISKWPSSIEAYGNNVRGAALLANAQPTEAIKWLTQAESKLKKSAAPAVNLMRAHQMTDDKSAANAAFDRANALDQASTISHLNLKRRDINTLLWVQPLPLRFFWVHHKRQKPQQIELIGRFWPYLAGPHLPYKGALYIGLFGVLVCLLSTKLVFGQMSTVCPSCGLARDPEDGLKTGNHEMCRACYSTFVVGASLTYQARVMNEERLSARRSTTKLLRRALSLLTPGSGHVYAGYGIAGFFLTWALCFGLVALLRPKGIWGAPQEIIHSSWFQLELLALVLIVPAVLVGLYVALKDIEPARARTLRHKTQSPQGSEHE